MDDISVFSEEKEYGKDYFAFPEEDYGKDGKLKPVRKRVLKKLLKYEYRFLIKPLKIALIVLAGITALLCLLGFTVDFSGEDSTSWVFWILAMIPYLYAISLVLQIPLIVAMVRYRANIFKKEGYLTMTLPVSAEEHFFAKRISALIATYIFTMLVGVSFIIVLLPLFIKLPMHELTQGLSEIFSLIFESGQGFSMIMLLVEFLLIAILSPIVSYSLLGAIGCWFHRSMSKVKVIFGLIGLYLLYSLVSFLVSTVLENGAFLDMTPLLLHVGLWVYILLNALAIFLLSRFEIRTLKYKFNIK